MSHRDLEGGGIGLYSGCVKLAVRWLLRTVNWSSIQFRDDCTWTPRLLATAALLWAWSDELTLVDRFQSMRRLCEQVFPRPQALAGSYQAFIKMLRRWTSELVSLLQSALRERGRQELAAHWQVLGFTMFGVDGRRTELPRTLSNERAYSAARKRRKPGRRSGYWSFLEGQIPRLADRLQRGHERRNRRWASLPTRQTPCRAHHSQLRERTMHVQTDIMRSHRRLPSVGLQSHQNDNCTRRIKCHAPAT